MARVCLLGFAFPLLTACLYVYTPSRQNIPLLGAEAAAAFAVGRSSGGFELAASGTSNGRAVFGASINVATHGNPSVVETEVLAGIAPRIDDVPRLRLEILALLGGGGILDDDSPDQRLAGGFGFAGAQAGLAYDHAKVALGVSQRVTRYWALDLTLLEAEAQSRTEYMAVFYEPVVFVRAGPAWLRGEVQFGLSVAAVDSNPDDLLRDAGMLSFALTSNLALPRRAVRHER